MPRVMASCMSSGEGSPGREVYEFSATTTQRLFGCTFGRRANVLSLSQSCSNQSTRKIQDCSASSVETGEARFGGAMKFAVTASGEEGAALVADRELAFAGRRTVEGLSAGGTAGDGHGSTSTSTLGGYARGPASAIRRTTCRSLRYATPCNASSSTLILFERSERPLAKCTTSASETGPSSGTRRSK